MLQDGHTATASSTALLAPRESEYSQNPAAAWLHLPCLQASILTTCVMMQPQVVSQPRSCHDLELLAAFPCSLWTVAAAVYAAPGAHTSCCTSALWQISHESQQDLHTSL